MSSAALRARSTESARHSAVSEVFQSCVSRHGSSLQLTVSLSDTKCDLPALSGVYPQRPAHPVTNLVGGGQTNNAYSNSQFDLETTHLKL